MVVTGDIAFLAAETRRIAGGAGRQKIQFRVNRACAFPCEPEFSVQYLFPVRMIFQEIFSQKWIGAVRPAVINGALPGIQAVFHVDGVSGTAFRAFSATVAEGAGKRRVRFKRSIGHDKDPNFGATALPLQLTEARPQIRAASAKSMMMSGSGFPGATASTCSSS